MTAARIIPFPVERTRRPEPPPNLWAEMVAWWLAWSAESAQVAADNLHAMSAALRRPR